MASVMSVSASHLPISRPHEAIRENIPVASMKENKCSSTSTCRSSYTRRRDLLKSAGLGLVGGWLSAVQLGRAEQAVESPQESSSSRLSYSRFLQYLDDGTVTNVDLLENGTVAIAEISNPVLNRTREVRCNCPA